MQIPAYLCSFDDAPRRLGATPAEVAALVKNGKLRTQNFAGIEYIVGHDILQAKRDLREQAASFVTLAEGKTLAPTRYEPRATEARVTEAVAHISKAKPEDHGDADEDEEAGLVQAKLSPEATKAREQRAIQRAGIARSKRIFSDCVSVDEAVQITDRPEANIREMMTFKAASLDTSPEGKIPRNQIARLKAQDDALHRRDYIFKLRDEAEAKARLERRSPEPAAIEQRRPDTCEYIETGSDGHLVRNKH